MFGKRCKVVYTQWTLDLFDFSYLGRSLRRENLQAVALSLDSLLVYLFIWLFRKLFFQNATSPTFIIRFLLHCTHIILRGSYIWLVLGLAIWRTLAIWRPSTKWSCI